MERPIIRTTIAAAFAVALMAACDSGDGKTLKDTVVPTTLPPPDTTPIESLPLDGAADPAIDPGVGSGAAAGDSALPIVPTEPVDGPMQLIGPWNDGTPIDGLYTCDGVDISPPLSWLSVPDGAVDMAIVMVDDDAAGDDPVAHWVIAGLDPESITLVEGDVPIGAIEATNSFGDVGWTGPCPPAGGGTHDYRFKLHALAQQVELGDGVPASEILPYLEDLTIASAELTGTYER
jgi:Raf kinase inhibitor-like YbhB/YbcL family protein